MIPVKVAKRIMPGVVKVPMGAWYNPNRGRTTLAESANNLTAVPNSPSGGMANNTALVEVEKL